MSEMDPFLRYQFHKAETKRRMQETANIRNGFIAFFLFAAIVYAILNAPN